MNLKTILLASAVALAAPAAAYAGDTTISYNVGAASDYIFRGVSQTDEKAQVFAGADASAGILYAGVWASNVDFGFSGNTEIDLYAGIKPVLGPVTFDFGVLTYNYPGETFLNAVEYKAGASITAPHNIALSLTDYYGTDSYNYLEFGVSAPLGSLEIGPFALSALASYGTQQAVNSSGALEYDNYKIAIDGTTKSGFVVELGYTDTDLTKANVGAAGYGLVDPSGYLLIKKNF